MNGLNHVRTGDDQIIVAAVEVLTAKILRGEVVILDAGAHGAIKDDDMILDGIQVAAIAIGLSSHK